MKIFKKLVTLCAAITLAFGVGASLAACDKEESSSSSASSSSTSVDSKVMYEFELKFEDGSPAEGYQIKLCTADNAICLTPVTTDANGKASVEITSENQDKAFVIHVMLNYQELQPYESRINTAGVEPIPVGYNGDVIQIAILA